MKKLVMIGKKMNDAKKETFQILKNLDKDIKQSDDKKKEIGIKKIAKTGLRTAACIVGTVATGGVAAAIWGGAAIGNGIALAVNCVRLANWKKQAKLYQEKKEQESKKYEEMDLELANLRNIYNKIQDRYIPPNIDHVL